MIVKCQRSLSTTEECALMMFYNKDRTHLAQFDLTADWDRIFGPPPRTLGEQMRTERFFAEVNWPDPQRPPTFVKRLPEQHW